MTLNLFLFEKINGLALHYLWLDGLAIFLAQYFEVFFLILLGLWLYKERKRFWPLFWQLLGAGVLARLVITELIRYLYPVSRPFVEHEVNLLISHAATPSLPSGHAAFYFALAALVYLSNKKAGSLFFGASLLIGLARVFVGLHWPLDILAGAIVGIFSAWLLKRIVSNRSKENSSRWDLEPGLAQNPRKL